MTEDMVQKLYKLKYEDSIWAYSVSNAKRRFREEYKKQDDLYKMVVNFSDVKKEKEE